MATAKVKERVAIAVTIVCGSAAAAIYWHNQHQVAPGITETQARQAGYESAAEMGEIERMGGKMLRDLSKETGLDQADFDFFKRTLEGGRERPILYIEGSLDFVSRPEQMRELVTILGQRKMFQAESQMWFVILTHWSQSPPGRAEVTNLTASTNKDLATIAKEVVTANNAKKGS